MAFLLFNTGVPEGDRFMGVRVPKDSDVTCMRRPPNRPLELAAEDCDG